MPYQKEKSKGSKINGLPFPSDIGDLTEKLGLSWAETLLLHEIRSGMNSKNKFNWRKQSTLAARMGCRVDTVKRAVKSLKGKGIIKVSMKGKHNKYNLNYFGDGEWSSGCEQPENDKTGGCEQLDQVAVSNLYFEKGGCEQLDQVAVSTTNKSKGIDQKKNNKSIINQSKKNDEKFNEKQGNEGTAISVSENVLKYGFELDDDESRKLNIDDWFRAICRKNPDLELQAENYVKERTGPNIYNPGGFRISVLNEIRAGTVKGFRYVSEEEAQRKVEEAEEKKKAAIDRNEKKRLEEDLIREKYDEALELYKAVPPEAEGADEIEAGLSAHGTEKPKKLFLISQIQRMKEILGKSEPGL